MSRVITVSEQETYIKHLNTTEAERQSIASYVQGTEEWLKSRKGRLTGSIMGSVCGHNFFCNHEKLLTELLWNTFEGNEATRYGTQFESTAAEIYEQYQRTKSVDFHIEHSGLIVHPCYGWMGYSPDGIVREGGRKGLLEIKCPFKKKLYPKIPMYYYDQIQYGLWLMQREYCDFVVFTPVQTSIERFEYDKEYVEEFLLERLTSFYFRKYLPLLIAQERGWLRPGDVHLPPDVLVEYFKPF